MGKVRTDYLINLGILIITGLTALAAFASWCDGRYAKTSDLTAQSDSVKELKGEMDALYLHLIPEPERASLKHPENVGR